MKKTIILFLVLAMLSSLAIAEQQGIHEPGTGIENPEMKEAAQGTGQGLEDGEPMSDGEKVMVQTRAQNGSMNQTRVRAMIQEGLENALGNVKNENARQRLESNMEKFQEKVQNRLQNMENVEIDEVDEETGAVKLKAKEQVKFLGFINGKATKKFNIDANGELTEKKPWYRFMYREINTEETE